jgi:hypothetical protein
MHKRVYVGVGECEEVSAADPDVFKWVRGSPQTHAGVMGRRRGTVGEGVCVEDSALITLRLGVGIQPPDLSALSHPSSPPSLPPSAMLLLP